MTTTRRKFFNYKPSLSHIQLKCIIGSLGTVIFRTPLVGCCCCYQLLLSTLLLLTNTYRSSRVAVFFKKGVLRHFAKFTRKHLCQSPFFNKVAGLRPATLLKKETPPQMLFREFCEIFKNSFS